MNDTVAFLLVAAVWLVLQLVILPRMGVPT